MHTEFTLYPQQFKNSLESKYSPLHLSSGPLQLSEQEKAFFNFPPVIEAPGSLEASVDTFFLYICGVGGFLYYKTHGCPANLKSEPQFWIPGKKVTAKGNVHLRQGLNYLVVQENKVSTTLNFKHPPTPDLKLSSACTQNKTTQNLKSLLRQLPHFQQIMKFELN